MITANSRGDFQSPETEMMGKAMIRAITNRRLSERKGKFTYFAERKAVGLCQIAPTRNEFGVANE
ncbi:MAG: hypothetical protein J6J37_08175 [Bacteroidaceae bacterium]|nr:hypothetical protein [Bacteroidaceae bacterium]